MAIYAAPVQCHKGSFGFGTRAQANLQAEAPILWLQHTLFCQSLHAACTCWRAQCMRLQGLFVEECKQLTSLVLESAAMDSLALGGCPSLEQLTLRCKDLQTLDVQ